MGSKSSKPMQQQLLTLKEQLDKQKSAGQKVEAVETLNKMGQVVHASDMGNCKKALKLHKRALEDIKLLDDGECPKLKAATLHLVALMHEGMSNDEEALKCYKEAAELAQEADPKSLETARIMTDYALLESDNKQYEEALKLFESSLEIQEQFAEDSQAFAETLTSIALTHKRLKQPEKELTAYLKALSKLQAREDAKPELLTCVLNNIAMLFLEKEDYSNCVKNLERAEAVSESLTAADHPDIKCAVAYNRGLYHLDKEEWKEALPHFQESLQIEKTHFDNSLRQGTSLMKLGVVYQNLGGDENIDTAMGYFIDAFEIFDWEEEGSLLCADALSHIGFIAVDHHKALQNLFNALEIQVNKGANKIVQATTHHRIAQVYEDSRRMQAAMQHYSQAHQLLHEAEPDTLRISKLCISMVKLLRSSGGHQVAIQPMSKAMMLQQKLIPQTVEFSESYVLMGDLLIDNEKYEPAMNHLGTAAMMQEKLSPGSNLLASTYIKIGELMSYLNKHNPAAQWFQKALTIQEKNQEKDRKRLDTLKDKDEKDKTEEELDEEDKLMSEVDDARLAIIDTNLKMAENFSEDGATPLALKFYNTGLAMQENLLGRSPDMAETYYSIAKVYQKGNEREKALENYTKALELFRECDETFLLENMLIKDLMDFHKSDGQHTEARKVKAILDGLLEKYRHN